MLLGARCLDRWCGGLCGLLRGCLLLCEVPRPALCFLLLAPLHPNDSFMRFLSIDAPEPRPAHWAPSCVIAASSPQPGPCGRGPPGAPEARSFGCCSPVLVRSQLCQDCRPFLTGATRSRQISQESSSGIPSGVPPFRTTRPVLQLMGGRSLSTRATARRLRSWVSSDSYSYRHPPASVQPCGSGSRRSIRLSQPIRSTCARSAIVPPGPSSRRCR